jgi:hypothetical protein
MTDRNEALTPAGNELELITSYLNGHLDPDRLEQVRRRLDDDPEFRDFAAPMLLTWRVPKHLARHPRPVGELEKHWDEFTKRAGFAHQRRRSRTRWLKLLGILAVVAVTSFYALKDQARTWYRVAFDYHTLSYAEGWVPFGEGRELQFGPGARIRVANKEIGDGGVLGVRLVGTARFRTRVLDTTATLLPEFHYIGIETAAGRVAAPNGEFTVSTRGDTTDVEVHHPTSRQFVGFMPLPGTALVFPPDGSGTPLFVREGQRARIVRGSKATLVP